MTTITNSDTRKTTEAQIITKPAQNLNWCIAVWPTPNCGRTKIDGNGYGWQIVRLQNSGKYTYNETMMGGIHDSLEDVRAMARECKYELI